MQSSSDPPVFFNGSEVAVKTEHKHLGMILDWILSLLSKSCQGNNNQSQQRYLNYSLFIQICIKDDLYQIYKLYVRPHLDYGDII